MRTLRSKYLSNIPIKEDNYKVDFIILEKYQSFSSEILRLSLLGLAVYGFLITNVLFKITDNNNNYILIAPFSKNKLLFVFAAISLLLASLFALGHRYYSSDCMTHFIRSFRVREKITLLKHQPETDPDVLQFEKILQSEIISFERDLIACKWLLILSAFLLLTGIMLFSIGLGCSLNAFLI